jgi:transposase
MPVGKRRANLNRMMILHRSSGSLAAAEQGHPPGGAKLMAHADWVRERMSAHDETTQDELRVALAGRGIEIHRATVGRFLHRLGLSNKKSLKASEQRRPEIANGRDL